MWKDIKGYEGFYQISDEGTVRRILKDRTRDIKCREGKYYTVNISKHGKKKTFAVHRLVAETFLERPEGYLEVNHKDGDKHNNRVENLEWVTQLENRTHAIRVLGKNPFGKQPRKVICKDPVTDEIVAEFHSIAEAARTLGKMSARAPITYACQGLQKTAFGYKWQYAD